MRTKPLIRFGVQKEVRVFTEEDRKRALKTLVANSGRVTKTLRELGYHHGRPSIVGSKMTGRSPEEPTDEPSAVIRAR